MACRFAAQFLGLEAAADNAHFRAKRAGDSVHRAIHMNWNLQTVISAISNTPEEQDHSFGIGLALSSHLELPLVLLSSKTENSSFSWGLDV